MFMGMSWANEFVRYQNGANVVDGCSKQNSVCICLVKQVTLVQLLTKVECCVVNETQMRQQSRRWVVCARTASALSGRGWRANELGDVSGFMSMTSVYALAR